MLSITSNMFIQAFVSVLVLLPLFNVAYHISTIVGNGHTSNSGLSSIPGTSAYINGWIYDIYVDNSDNIYFSKNSQLLTISSNIFRSIR